MKQIIAVVVLALTCGCASQEAARKPNAVPKTVPRAARSTPPAIVYEGGDGSSFEKAVIIKGAPNSSVGVRAESTWIRRNHPGWRKGRQALVGNNGKNYDRIDYTTQAGETKTIYFDITDFFGKW